MEEAQKKAINSFYNLLPDLYLTSSPRKKIRKLFHEEAAFKSQFFTLWAMNSFKIFLNRLFNFLNVRKLLSFDFLDPISFFLDNSMALINLKKENKIIHNKQKISQESFFDEENAFIENIYFMITGFKSLNDKFEKHPITDSELIHSIRSIFEKFKIATVSRFCFI